MLQILNGIKFFQFPSTKVVQVGPGLDKVSGRIRSLQKNGHLLQSQETIVIVVSRPSIVPKMTTLRC